MKMSEDWQRFVSTGKIEDYLNYCGYATNRKNAHAQFETKTLGEEVSNTQKSDDGKEKLSG